jgi:23S rRNA (adenine2503-C2)-methyltransferase
MSKVKAVECRMSTLLHPVRRLERQELFSSRHFDRQVGIRYLFQLSDACNIETSLYKHYLHGQPQDISIDISTMVGCPMGCTFCAATYIGFRRRLSAEEMVEQVSVILGEHDDPSFTKVLLSFQGIGEPSLIAGDVLHAGRTLLRLDRRFVLSIATMGANLSGIRLWRKEQLPIATLQFSCSGSDNAALDWLMSHRPSFERLVEEALLCAASPSIETVNLNYILMAGLNDRETDVDFLIRKFAATPIVVKVSALNETKSAVQHGLKAATKQQAEHFCNELRYNGVNSYVFGAFSDTNISCGQLAFEVGTAR